MGQWHTKGQCDGAKGPMLCLNDKAFVYFWLTVQIPSNRYWQQQHQHWWRRRPSTCERRTRGPQGMCYDFPLLLLPHYIPFHSDRVPLLSFMRLSSISLSSFLFLDMTRCYVSVTMSTQSPSPNFIIITPIPRRYSCFSSSSSPSDYSDISPSQSPSYFEVTTTPSPY